MERGGCSGKDQHKLAAGSKSFDEELRTAHPDLLATIQLASGEYLHSRAYRQN